MGPIGMLTNGVPIYNMVYKVVLVNAKNVIINYGVRRTVESFNLKAPDLTYNFHSSVTLE